MNYESKLQWRRLSLMINAEPELQPSLPSFGRTETPTEQMMNFELPQEFGGFAFEEERPPSSEDDEDLDGEIEETNFLKGIDLNGLETL